MHPFRSGAKINNGSIKTSHICHGENDAINNPCFLILWIIRMKLSNNSSVIIQEFIHKLPYRGIIYEFYKDNILFIKCAELPGET